MEKKVIQSLVFMNSERVMSFLFVFALILISCNDDMGLINISSPKTLQLSIPDAELVQVRSVANESECKISGIQVFVYNDSHTSSPVYYQEGTTDLSFLFGNGTASPTVTLKEYIPADKERIYVVCNLTNRSSVSGTGDFLIDETVSEEQLRNYTSQGLISGISNLKDGGQSIPMYGWMEWNEKATSNVCLLTRCLAKITVDAAADLFSGKQVYWEWENLNYSDFVLGQLHCRPRIYPSQEYFQIWSANKNASMHGKNKPHLSLKVHLSSLLFPALYSIQRNNSHYAGSDILSAIP